MKSQQNANPPVFDSELVRTNAAWFAAGVNASCSYVFVATLAVSAVGAILAAIFEFDAGEAVLATTAAHLGKL